MTLFAQCLTTTEELERIVPQWERLHAASRPPLPFTSPHWVLPWWRHFARATPMLRDELRCFTFTRGDGELEGVAPLVLSSRPAFGPLRYRELQVAGADQNLTEVNPVLCHPDAEREVYEALTKALRASSEWDTARWWVREGSPLEQGLRAQPGVRFEGERPMFQLELPSTWEEFKSTRSRNIKESMRKGYNSLKRDGHAFTLRVRSSADELPRALDRFLALHRERARATEGIAHPDWFASTDAQAFVREVAYRFAAKNQARVFELEIAGEVVASRIGFVVGPELYLYYSGYAEAWSKYSVMTTLTAEALRSAIGEGLKVVNLSFGRDVSKTRWSPTETMFRGAAQTAPALKARGFEVIEPRLRKAMQAPRMARLRALFAHSR